MVPLSFSLSCCAVMLHEHTRQALHGKVLTLQEKPFILPLSAGS